MRFTYQARTPEGELRQGLVEAPTIEIAISSLQRKNLIIISVLPEEEKHGAFGHPLSLFEHVSTKEIVILSRQMATLFQAKVPVVESLKIIAEETDNYLLKKELSEVLDDIEGGSSMSQSMARHPNIFSSFYVNMVRSGEESGKLDDVFGYLADYLERSYELISKARNAMIYPAFVLVAFVVVVSLMLILVIPNLATILEETGQEVPFFTSIVLGASKFLQQFWFLVLIFIAFFGTFVWRYIQTQAGRTALHKFELAIPLVGELYRKLYMSRIADNIQTLTSGGIPVIRALEITSDVVGSEVYRAIILDSIEAVKAGSTISGAFSRYAEIPPLMTQMIRIGEETGRLDQILKSLAGFYRKEVDSLVDTLVHLIEPLMILVLGVGIGGLVAAILVPLYNITASIK